jgi:hypothetical protein
LRFLCTFNPSHPSHDFTQTHDFTPSGDFAKSHDFRPLHNFAKSIVLSVAQSFTQPATPFHPPPPPRDCSLLYILAAILFILNLVAIGIVFIVKCLKRNINIVDVVAGLTEHSRWEGVAVAEERTSAHEMDVEIAALGANRFSDRLNSLSRLEQKVSQQSTRKAKSRKEQNKTRQSCRQTQMFSKHFSSDSAISGFCSIIASRSTNSTFPNKFHEESPPMPIRLSISPGGKSHLNADVSQRGKRMPRVHSFPR